MTPALRDLQAANIAPVDLAQAAIGPGMAVYTRYAQVLDAEGNVLSVKQALALINERLDIVLAEQEGDFDADTPMGIDLVRTDGFCGRRLWHGRDTVKSQEHQRSWNDGRGHLSSSGNKVRLLKPEELNANWEPETDTRKSVWEALHHLVRALNQGGETGAATLGGASRSRADAARELAYRLYVLCERKKRAQEALTYNALVQSWPEIQRLASERETKPAEPTPDNNVQLVQTDRTEKMAITNHERVGKALELLKDGLAPFVTREMKNQHEQMWLQVARESVADTQTHLFKANVEPDWDAASLLSIMWNQWDNTFRNPLGAAERSLVSELRDIRNKWAHQKPFSSDDAYRALDSVGRLLSAVVAPRPGRRD